ncbi:alkaline phosphatase D family protein [Algoriphagus sp. NF]|uniref:alkaline phosphatase D family protein n=1 Tax=Algoriphagus sp. NF TaxID=2992756 RepID=UPI00237A90E2|nr:alkaline phosphatase D family protein [Algoriphagus sp. NF]MDE0561702.1 alkaline phosphatase D family protein [Algoriphagus sp. NF]
MKNLQTLTLFFFLGLPLFFACKPSVLTSEEEEITRIAFGSCNRQNRPQPLWQPIVSDNPDLWIWMGDNIYGDSPNLDTLRAKYAMQDQVADYQNLKRTSKIIGIWDDHDYGINDGGKFFAQKAASQQLMLDFLDVPQDAPERKREGAYAAHLFGKGENLVKVILLDARYHRDTLMRIDRVYQPNLDGQILGEEQWKWLENELKTSSAKVNLIVSGIQFLPTQHAYEKWANFPQERERLLSLIAASGANTPILLSGDRHIAELMKLTDERFPDGIYEITASGLTHTWSTISEEPNRYRIGDLIAKLNYGLAEIDWKNEEIAFQIKGEAGASYANLSIPFSIN